MERKDGVPLKGWLYLAFFASLIASGIVVKRVYGHPEFMAVFHLPAAVFLVLAGNSLTEAARRKRRATYERWKAAEGA